MIIRNIIMASLLTSLSTWALAETEDLIIGKWKTIDDRTGYSRADVVVKKNSDGTYTGTIVETRTVPGRPKMETCTNCPGHLKNKPYIGLPFIYGFKQNPDNPYEYMDGKILDPIGGKIYKGKARIATNGKHMILRGYVGVSVIGRSVTCIKY